MKRKLLLSLLFVFQLNIPAPTDKNETEHKEITNNDDDGAFNKEWEKTLTRLQEAIPKAIDKFIKKLPVTTLEPNIYQKFIDLVEKTIRDKFHKLEHTFYQYKKLLREKLNQMLNEVKTNIQLQKERVIYGKNPQNNSDWILAFESAQPAILLVFESFKKHE